MRRRVLLPVLLALAGCGLSERPYAERRQWPLAVPRPVVLPPRRGGRVLLVRSVRAGPGLEARGLQSVAPDGSIRTAFYEEWAVPPADAAEAALRSWLASCGRFAAVVGPGSRVAPGLVLEGELDALWTEAGQARAALSVVAFTERDGTEQVRLQRSFSADVKLARTGAPAQAEGMRAALAVVFGQVEAALAGL
jgi:cholesterol transport system auxiliary component